MAKWYNKFASWLKKTFPDIDLPKQVQSWLNSITQGGMTQRDKELSDTSLENQQILNEEEFERKQKWFEMYESPAARARQYEEAGLNKMLLAGGGASVSATGGIGSAGSAGASASGSGTFSDVFGPLMQLGMYKLQKRDIESQILKRQTETDAQRIENKWNERVKDIQLREAEQRIALMKTQGNVNEHTVAKLVHETEYARVLAMFAPSLIGTKVAEQDANASRAYSDVERNVSEIALNSERVKEIDSIIKVNGATVSRINAEVSKIRAEIGYITSQTGLTEQMVQESKARVDKINEEIKLLGKQIGLSEKDLEYYLWNHSKDVSNKMPFGISVHTQADAEDYRKKTGH